MKNKFLISSVLALTVMLTACAPKAAVPTKKGTVSTAIPPTAKPATAPTKIVKPASTPSPAASPTLQSVSTPTPRPTTINDLVVQDQAINSDSVLVNLVDAMKPGWVVIFTDENGQPGTVLGYAAVPAGISEDVKVTIDSKEATDKLIAMLHIDEGKIGTFEYPGPDEPVKNALLQENVMAVFNRLSN